MTNVILIATSAAWVAFELWLVVFRRSDASATRKDVGTLGRLNLVIYASVTAAAVISSFPFGHLALPPAVRGGGIVLGGRFVNALEDVVPGVPHEAQQCRRVPGGDGLA